MKTSIQMMHVNLRYHKAMHRLITVKVNTLINGAGGYYASTFGGTCNCSTEVTAGGITLTSRKAFDIPHPTKKGHRLRHICLEGPESGCLC